MRWYNLCHEYCLYKFFNGKNLGLPDFIFFGNFMWAEKCSSENLFENLPNIHKWYSNIKKLNRL